MNALAGWALDHQIGLAIHHLEFLPLGAQATRTLPEYVETKRQVDSHSHERKGGAAHQMTAADARRALKNILHANPAGLDGWLAYQLNEGLEALEFGETTPIFRSVTTQAHSGLREINCKLQALMYVEYQRGTGKKKFKAQDEAAQLFGVERDTIRTWEKRSRNELGTLAVSRQLALARNAGASGSTLGAEWFGRPALEAAAEKFKAIRTHQAGENGSKHHTL